MSVERRLRNDIRRLREEINHLKKADCHEVRIKLMQRNIELEQRYMDAMTNLKKMNELLNKYKLLLGDIDIVDFHKNSIDEL